MEVPNIWDSVLTSCQWTACHSWSRWEGSCCTHPLHRVCCRQSPDERQSGSQCPLHPIPLGLFIYPGTEFTAHCVDAQGKFLLVVILIPVFAHPSVHASLLFVCVRWGFSLPLDVFCLTLFSEQDELVFGILPLPFICMLVPIVCARELDT